MTWPSANTALGALEVVGGPEHRWSTERVLEVGSVGADLEGGVLASDQGHQRFIHCGVCSRSIGQQCDVPSEGVSCDLHGVPVSASG